MRKIWLKDVLRIWAHLRRQPRRHQAVSFGPWGSSLQTAQEPTFTKEHPATAAPEDYIFEHIMRETALIGQIREKSLRGIKAVNTTGRISFCSFRYKRREIMVTL